MSSNNGIYVLQNLSEYRVTEASSIDNLDYFLERTKEHDAMQVCYFGCCQVFTDKSLAMAEAIRLHEMDYTEYGICFLPPIDCPFPNMSIEEAQKLAFLKV